MMPQLLNSSPADSLLQEQQPTCEHCRRLLEGAGGAERQLSDLAAIDIYAVPLSTDN